MCLIIAILVLVRDRPLLGWPLSIQPNSAIAILTTVGKTAMMMAVASSISQLKWRHMQLKPRPLYDLQVFDDASRGPWGSVVMLCRFSLRSFLGWSLAIVTIAALAIEPSAQNILDFELRPVELTDARAEIPIARDYYSKALGPAGWGDRTSRIMSSDLPRFQTAVLNGLSGQVLPPNLVCAFPATRCNWDEPCTEDGLIQEVCHYNNIPGWLENPDEFTDPDDYPTLTYQNPASGGFAEKTQILFSEYGTFNASSALLGPWVIIRHDGNNPYWNTVKGEGDEDTYQEPPHPQIFAASFDLCEKTYINSSIPGSPIGKNIITSQPLFRDPEAEADGNGTIMGEEGQVYSMRDKSATYRTDRTAVAGLFEYLKGLLEWEAYIYLDAAFQSRGTDMQWVNLDFLLQYSEDLEEVATNLADTLTNLMRNDEKGGDNKAATMVPGKAFGTAQFLVVRWEWVILPAIETVLAVVLLVACMIVTGRKTTGVNGVNLSAPQLGTSAMAFLAYPLTGWTEDETRVEGKQTAARLEDLGRGMRARFAVDDVGRWRFWRA